MLRIETRGVNALARSLALDETRGILYTGGDDKTVRVWRNSDLTLLDTWRLPAGEGPEGQINAVALTPDRRFLAVAGWTGQEWDQAISIYVFDTAIGQIVKRITGLQNVVGVLRFSPDGQMLAIGFAGAGGILVTRWNQGSLAFFDTQFPGSVFDVDFFGVELAVVGADSGVRIYNTTTGKITRQKILAEGRIPLRVRFSASGDQFAVGFHDTVSVGVYASPTLALSWKPDTTGTSGQSNLSVVAWSADGKRLYAGGDPGANDQPSRVFTWLTMTREAPTAAAVARHRLAALAPTRDGGVLFLAEDPAIGRLGQDGRIVRATSGGTLDLRIPDGGIKVSSDASRIDLPADGERRRALSFDVARLKLTNGEQAGTVTASIPPKSTVAVVWKAGEPGASVAGVACALKEFEFIRAVGRLPGGEAILATEYGVRLYDRKGKLLWFADVGGVAWAIQASQDGRHVIATSADGTVTWLRTSDGAHVLRLFVHAQTQEWVAWTPDGYYASSPNGDQLIGWQLNRTKQERADFYQASQFERVLYRPDLIRTSLRDSDRPASRSMRSGFQIDQLATIAPPRIDLLELGPKADPKRPGLLRARFKASRNGGRMLDWTVFVDDIPMTRYADRTLPSGEGDAFTREIEFVPLTASSVLRIEVGTEMAIGVKEVSLPTVARPPEPVPGDLYLLAIGVRQFPLLPGKFELQYTERDAQEVGAFFAQQSGRQFRKVHARVVSDQSADVPTATAITNALGFLKQAGPDDTVILFLASHGVRDQRGNYYFAAADSRMEDLCSILREENAVPADFCRGVLATSGTRQSFIEWKTFYDALGASAGRRLLVVDTCEAGNISGRTEAGTLRKRSASSRFSLLLAAGDGEESQEYSAGRHGLFTYAWLNSLHASTGNGIVTLQQSFESARSEVARLRDPRGGPMTPSLDGPENWRSLPLAKVKP
jgi:WD40 repeat protein